MKLTVLQTIQSKYQEQIGIRTKQVGISNEIHYYEVNKIDKL